MRNILDKLMKCRTVLLASRKTWNVQQVDDRPLLQQGEIGRRLLQSHEALRQSLPSRRERPCELRPWCEGGPCFPRCRVVSSLEHLAEPLRITLSPPAGERGIVVNEDVGAIR